jgi:hypothetical protein
MTSSGETFSDLFWSRWEKMNYEMPKDSSFCFMFEFCSSKIKTIVVHEKESKPKK